ncbi:MAG: cobalt transporter CbiM [Candidatus Hydrogenedentes bacterium]|nr:cobalt transporter CbiM [Candidatus Hydrogenedentota bacterium]
MHIAEGIIPGPVLGAGALLAAAGVAAGLRKLDEDRMAPVAVLSSTLFVASLIHVPVGPAAAHLVLNGLAGLILGWAVFPSFLVALLLQAVFFGYGGLTTLGLNTLNMALPGVVCYYLFNHPLMGSSGRKTFVLGFAAGAMSIALSCAMLCASLLTAGRELLVLAQGVFLAHIPLMILEGLVTGSAVVFLRRVRPEVFAHSTDAAKPLELDTRDAFEQKA